MIFLFSYIRKSLLFCQVYLDLFETDHPENTKYNKIKAESHKNQKDSGIWTILCNILRIVLFYF